MKKALFLALLFLIGLSAIGQVLKPISWEVKLSEESPDVGDEIEIRFKAKIEKDWYLYSSDFDPDLGPMITEFYFNGNEAYELIGNIRPIDPKKKYDSLWEGEYTYFTKEGVFVQKVKILKAGFSITGNYTYQVCSDVDGKCIPFDEEFTLSAKTGKSEELKKKMNRTIKKATFGQY